MIRFAYIRTEVEKYKLKLLRPSYTKFYVIDSSYYTENYYNSCVCYIKNSQNLINHGQALTFCESLISDPYSSGLLDQIKKKASVAVRNKTKYSLKRYNLRIIIKYNFFTFKW